MSAPVNEGRRLSAAQAGVWYAQRLHPESPVFNLGGHLEIRGPLDADLLGAALARVVAEDDTLGLRFREVDGVPEQSFGPVAGTPPEFIDVSAEPDPAEAARHLMRVDLDTPRDLETGPLFGNLIFRLGPELHLWYLRAHHLIHDGYTTGLFCRRVAAVYTELATGHPAGRAFGSFARLLDGEDDYFGSAARQRDAGYWHKLMDGAPHPAGPVSARAPELRIVRETTHMPAEGFAALRRFADSAGVGWPQAVLCAAVLHRHLWTGETDVLLSLALPGRLTRNVPGMTANVLPLRCAVDRDATCAELARRVAGLAAAAQWHQRYGSADLMNDLGWPAQGRRQFGPMVNIMADDEVLSFAGTPARIRMMSTGGTADDLSLTFTREDGGLRIDATIDAAYTDCTDLTGYRRTFLQTVTAMTVGDGVLAGDVEALAPGECERVVETWNATGDGSAAEHSLGALFEGQAEVRPGAVALVSGAQRLTYGELNIRANRLARLLLSRGVRRGGVVGVLLERGLDFAVALVGVVKTGAAYVVLDPDFPDERLDLVARGAGVSVTVTGTEFAGRVTGPVVLADAVDTGGLPGDDLDLHVAPGDVACVMFTSGSTGRPKGVAAPHRALVGSLAGQQYATFGPGEVFLQCSPVSWDGFSLEFWGALLFGGTCVLQPGQRPEPGLIAALSAEHGVTMLQLSSGLFNLMAEEYPSLFDGLKAVFTGGETASGGHVARVLERGGGVVVANAYGPAESMGFTTTFEVPDGFGGRSVPVGRPIANKRVYLLDSRLRPVPVGVVGEAYLGGVGLAHGYTAAEGMTAGRFVADPFSDTGGRLYRSGDLARWRADGVLEFVGRSDDQVKVRGFRVEPGEVERLLLEHGDVDQAAVVAVPDGSSLSLVGYVVGAGLDGRELRDRLRGSVPEHLVPSVVMVLPRLPLLPSGKLDRKALPVPGRATSTGGRPPRDAREEILCGLFAEVLGVPSVTIDDDFFDLGGHSLLAGRVAARARQALNAELTIRDVFQAPNVAALAGRLGVPARGLPAAVAQAERPDPLPLSYAQRRLWFLSRLEGANATYNVPLTVRLSGDLDVAALEAAFGDLMRRHEVLRTVYGSIDGEPYQRVLDRPPVPWEVRRVDLLELALDDAAARPFDLTAEPPIRVTLFDLGGGDRVLLILLHHIATDGESLRPLFADLSAAYTARRAGRAPQGWTPLPVQYADYGLWQRSVLGAASDAGGLLFRELEFWRERLDGIPEELGLALDRARPRIAGHQGGAVEVGFGRDLSTKIMSLARAERCTPFMVLQAALALTLTRFGAGEDIPIGAPVAGRSADGLDDLVGFFVNTLVLRTDTSGDPSFRELLARVRNADLDAFAHQETPFDLLVEALNPARSLSRHPLFQVCLGLEHAGGLTPDLPGAEAGPCTVVHSGAVKFDLEFLLQENADGIGGAVLYSLDIFDRETVERMVAAFSRVLAEVVVRPEVRLGEVEVLAPGERELIVDAWNATGGRAEAETTLPRLFEEQARARPGAPALIFGSERLTYGDLNARANQLAHLLVERGVRRGDVVGVLFERGPDFAAALVGVVKTGAAYLVLDPAFPDARLRLVAETASTVVTCDALATRLNGPMLRIGEAVGLPATDPGLHVDPGDVACVMFTSGSTGRPKGVATPHRAMAGTLAGQQYATFGPGEVFLQCSPVSWDGFSLEFWGALLFGGTCVLQPGQRPEPGLIAALSTEHGVTMLQLSSGLFNLMVEEYPLAFDTVRIAFTGGETASATHVARILARTEEARPAPESHSCARRAGTVSNAYGPAESMGFSTTYEVPPGFDAASVPIGRPVDGKSLYVLDERLQPVPTGVVGEVYLGGVGLAHGYAGAPALTADRFVADPFSAEGGRLYRSGDLARWRNEGVLEFAGRVDDQVKIRGFRVEPAEVERALLEENGVVRAAVLALPHQGSTRLVGYVVGAPGLDGREVRDRLRRSMPEYLVPSVVTVLPELPLMSNGKLDRRALPVPEAAGAVDGRAPRDTREQTLCGLFAEVLGVSLVSIDDDFFDLGGHSLLAARLAARTLTVLGVELSISDIFQAPTVALLAERLPAEGTQRRSRPALKRRTRSGSLL